ncbi:MAG: hypothetical protein DMG57_09185 [Acidobacteria bacterium]|nr:MAG: hypothetical protein DMG57_09185 [Acidobacteriota bacterium]
MDTENSVIGNAGFRSVREIIIVSTMTPFFIALLAGLLDISDPGRSAGWLVAPPAMGAEEVTCLFREQLVLGLAPRNEASINRVAIADALRWVFGFCSDPIYV